MPVQKIKSGRVNIPVDNFVGDNGVVFFDEADGLFRLGDGFTPGGITLSSGGEGGFILPTASTTVKGGVRVDGTTITIANGVITAQASLLIGPQGLKGDAGANGANGNDGAPGAPGQNGNDGAPGVAGLNGNDGAPGAPGQNGNDGAPGVAGLNGNDGAPGPPGPVIAATASVLGGVIVGGGINVTQNGTISVSFAGLASENFVETRGFLTAVSFNDLTDKPNLEGSYSFSIAADDSTQFEISAGNLVQIIGAQGVTTTADADGQIIITGPDLTEYATESYVNAAVTSAASPINANGTLSLPVLTSEPNNLQAGQIALAHGTSWDPLNKNDGKPYMALYAGQGWIDIGGLTTTDVYSQILELS